MTSGHKRKEVASVSLLSEACHLMAGIFKRGVTININTQTPTLDSLVSHLVKRRASAKRLCASRSTICWNIKGCSKVQNEERITHTSQLKQENCQLYFRQPRQHRQCTMFIQCTYNVHCTWPMTMSIVTYLLKVSPCVLLRQASITNQQGLPKTQTILGKGSQKSGNKSWLLLIREERGSSSA